MSTASPRVALVYDSIYPRTKGGGERRFYEIGRRCADQFQVGYFFHGTYDQDPGLSFGSHVGVGGTRPMYTAHGRRSIGHGLEFAHRLWRPLLQFKPNLIDCSSVSYAAIPVCALVGRLCHAPLVITWHEYVGSGWASYLRRPLANLAKWVERTAPYLAYRNVAVSPFTAHRLKAGARVDADIIPNGVDWGAISDARPAPDETDVLFVGRLMHQKRVDLLIAALQLLPENLRPLRVTIVGDGPERPSLQALATHLPSGIAVHWIPSIGSDAELYGRMKSSKVLVLPSVQEGYGLVVAEAQASGAIPIVVRHVNSAATDLVDDNQTGLICDPTPADLTRMIVKLLSDDKIRQRMRVSAIATAERRDWRCVSQTTADLFQSLLVG